MHADALVEPEHHREKKCHDQAAGERRFKRARQDCAGCAGADCREQPGKAVAKNAPGRGATNLRQPKTKRFEHIIAEISDGGSFFLAVTRFQHFLGEQAYIHDANNSPGAVHNRECKELIEDKEFACFQHSRAHRNRNDPTHHDFFQPRLERRGQQPPRGQDSRKASLGIGGEEINHAFTHAFAADALQRGFYRHACIEQGKIFARVIDDRRIEIWKAKGLTHQPLLRDERCLCCEEHLPLR